MDNSNMALDLSDEKVKSDLERISNIFRTQDHKSLSEEERKIWLMMHYGKFEDEKDIST